MTSKLSTITPQQLYSSQTSEDYSQVIDVRSSAEFRAGHIPGAHSIPIEVLSLDALQKHFGHSDLGHSETLYLTCLAGPRAKRAAERLQQAGFYNIALIDGGMQAWQQAGFPVTRCGNAIALERQVQIAIGLLLVLKVFLGFSVHELFFALTAVIGGGLIIAGTTRWCGMANLMARMPWNQGVECAEHSNASA